MKKGMGIIVKTVARILTLFVGIFGVYTVAFGHITPGGGFAGGVMIASVLILLVLAEGREGATSVVSERASHLMDSVGALIFLGLAFLGLSAGGFFINFVERKTVDEFFGAGTMLWSNMAIGIKVSAALFAVYLALAAHQLPEEGEEG